jgi:cold shock CspA family protein
MKGTIKQVANAYLFVQPDEGGNDVFVHRSACPGDSFPDLCVGDRLSFDVVDSQKNPGKQCAANVSVLGH